MTRATAPKSAFFEGFSDPTSGFSKPFQPLATEGGKKDPVSAMMETGAPSNRAKNGEFGAVALIDDRQQSTDNNQQITINNQQSTDNKLTFAAPRPFHK